MKTSFLYIHGLNSDRNSRKYLDLVQFFSNEFQMDCLEWKNDDSIDKLLNNTVKKYENNQQLILFGDSTGANFAYQLRELRTANSLNSILILCSPLLDLQRRIAHFEFPTSLLPFIKTIDQIQDCLVIAPIDDEIISHDSLLKHTSKDTIILIVKDSHRLIHFQNYLDRIKEYIKSKLT